MSEDPVRDGTNFYAYCGNNPVNYTDPSGYEDVPFSWSQGTYDVFGKISNIDTGSSWYNNIVDYTLCVPAGIFNLAASVGNVVTNMFGAANEGIDFLDENVPSLCTPTGSVRSTIDGAFFVISVMAPEIAAWQQASAIAAQLKSASAASKGGTTVLGHYPEYVKLAEKLDAKVFQVPTEVWNKMTPAEQWAANAKFLDRAITRGDTFQLATKASEARAGSFFERELQYLAGKGYTIGSGGTSLLPPVAP